MNSLASLTTLFYFTTLKTISLTTLLHCFTFTTIKMKSLTTFFTLFYFITTNPRDRTTLTTLLLSLFHQIVFSPGISVLFQFACVTVISLSESSVESYMLYYLTMFTTIRHVLSVPLLMEKALFTWAFRS